MKCADPTNDLLSRQFLRSFILEYGFLDDGKVWIALPDRHIFQVDKFTLNVLLDVNAGKTIRESSEKYGIDTGQIEYLVKMINEHGGLTTENNGKIERFTINPDTDIAGYIILLFIMGVFQAYYFLFHAHTFLMVRLSEGIFVAAIALVAILFHEAGHFLFTWNFTGIKPKAGFSINLIFPVIYVDTQSSWRLPKNKRFVVNTGGIFFDLVVNTIAAAAALSYPALEYYVTPFLLTQYMRWSILLNPLFKGDGYWIVSDTFGIVNMEQKGIAELKKKRFNLLSLFGAASIILSILSLVGLVWLVLGLAGSVVRGAIWCKINFLK